jgi:hypothetical protein
MHPFTELAGQLLGLLQGSVFVPTPARSAGHRHRPRALGDPPSRPSRPKVEVFYGGLAVIVILGVAVGGLSRKPLVS